MDTDVRLKQVMDVLDQKIGRHLVLGTSRGAARRRLDWPRDRGPPTRESAIMNHGRSRNNRTSPSTAGTRLERDLAARDGSSRLFFPIRFCPRPRPRFSCSSLLEPLLLGTWVGSPMGEPWEKDAVAPLGSLPLVEGWVCVWAGYGVVSVALGIVLWILPNYCTFNETGPGSQSAFDLLLPGRESLFAASLHDGGSQELVLHRAVAGHVRAGFCDRRDFALTNRPPCFDALIEILRPSNDVLLEHLGDGTIGLEPWALTVMTMGNATRMLYTRPQGSVSRTWPATARGRTSSWLPPVGSISPRNDSPPSAR